jgi:hypothetical protein
VPQVCNGVTARGMAALSDLRRLRMLELSYTEIRVRSLGIEYQQPQLSPYPCLPGRVKIENVAHMKLYTLP